MSRKEIVEQLVMILVIIAWIPWIFGYEPTPWYETALYATVIPLLLILVNRLLRYRKAVEEAEDFEADDDDDGDNEGDELAFAD